MKLTHNNICDIYELQSTAKLLTKSNFVKWIEKNGQIIFRSRYYMEFTYKSITASADLRNGYLSGLIDLNGTDNSIMSDVIDFNK